MLRSNKIHDNGLYFKHTLNHTTDVYSLTNTGNLNYGNEALDNLSQELKQEKFHAYNNNYVSESFSISEWDLYGSSRLGARNIDKLADVVFLASRNYNWINSTVTNEYIAPTASFTYKKYRLLGAKTFELTNHLGNVITTISDRKLMVQDPQNLGFVHHYLPEILSIGEQYAFGMSMPGRTFSVEKYRYGMNTQEKDDDIFEGAFTAEYWEYDSRVGRRWNLDPIFKNWESPYACFNNNPIWYADPLGLDGEKRARQYQEKNGGELIQTPEGNWSVDKDFIYEDKNSSIGKGSGVVSKVFKDNIFERVGKGIVSVTKKGGKAIVKGLRKLEELQAKSKGKTYGEGENWVNSFNTGGKGGYEFNKYKVEFEVGIFSTGEDYIGLYLQKTITTSLKGTTENKGKPNALNFDLPIPSLSFFAKANSGNPFNDPTIKNDTKLTMEGNAKLAGMTAIGVSTEISLKDKSSNTSVGIEIGKSTSSKIEGGISNTTTFFLRTDLYKISGK